MINEKEILKELDERINIQNRNIERVIQVSNNQAELVLLEREIATYQSVKKLIKEKSAHGAATPMSTLLNKQEQYNTDQEKIEPIKLAQEIFALCMKIQEGEDGKVEHRKKGRCLGPTVFVDFYGHVAQLDVEISPDGWSEEEGRKEKFSFYLGDYWGHQQKRTSNQVQREIDRTIRRKKRKWQ